MGFQGIDDHVVVSTVLEQWNRLQDERRPRLWIMQEVRLAWERKWGSAWGEIEDGRSHRFMPEAYELVESSVARTLQAVMPSSDFFQTIARRPEDEQKAPIIESKLKWDNYRMHHRKTFKNFVKRAFVDGNVPWAYVWHKEQAVIRDDAVMRQKDEMTSMGIQVEVNDPAGLGFATQEKTTFEGGRLVVGDIWNYYQDRHPDDPRFAFRINRTLQNKEYLQAKWGALVDENGQPIYNHLDELGIDPTWLETSDNFKRQLDASVGYQPLEEGKVEILTFCGDLNLKEDGYFHNIFGVIANRRHLLRFCANPRADGAPIWNCFTLIPNPNDPHGLGTGIVEPCLGLFDGINVRMNQVFDANALAIQPPLMVVKNAVTDAHQLVWGPWEKNYIQSQGDITPMTVPKDSLQLGQNEMSFFKGEIASVAGSMQLGGADNASQTQGVQQQTMALAAETMTQFCGVMEEMLRAHTNLTLQCMDQNNPVLLRLKLNQQGEMLDENTGEQLQPGTYWKNVTGADIQGEYDFEIITAAEMARSAQQVQQEQAFMQMLSQDQKMQAYIDFPDYVRKALRKNNFTDITIKSEEQVQNEQLQQQQQQLAQQQAMGQAGGPSQTQGDQSGSGGGGVPSTPGNAGSGGSGPRAPYPQQLVGPTRNAGR